MPVIHPAEIWQKQSGRWDGIPEMFKLKDRWGRDMVLGMTHEEVIAWLAAREIRSYRDLPQIWYQIQTKERDEARPALGRAAHARVRHEGLVHARSRRGRARPVLRRPRGAPTGKIFERCGLRFYVVQSDTGMMGGLGAHEFLAPCAAGEDEIALCASCGYAANVEIARAVPAAPAFPAGGREEVATPNARTIAEVSELLKIDPRLTIKSLLYAHAGGVRAGARARRPRAPRAQARPRGGRGGPRRPARGDRAAARRAGRVGGAGGRARPGDRRRGAAAGHVRRRRQP